MQYNKVNIISSGVRDMFDYASAAFPCLTNDHTLFVTPDNEVLSEQPIAITAEGAKTKEIKK